MFRATFKSFGNAFRGQASRFATTTEPKQNHTRVGKLILFFINNRQPLFNVMAIYFVLSMSVHNLRMKESWEDKDKEVTNAKKQFADLESKLSNTDWQNEVANKVKASKDPATTFQTELQTLVDSNQILRDSDQVVLKSSKDIMTEKFNSFLTDNTTAKPEGGTKMI